MLVPLTVSVWRFNTRRRSGDRHAWLKTLRREVSRRLRRKAGRRWESSVKTTTTINQCFNQCLIFFPSVHTKVIIIRPKKHTKKPIHTHRFIFFNNNTNNRKQENKAEVVVMDYCLFVSVFGGLRKQVEDEFNAPIALSAFRDNYGNTKRQHALVGLGSATQAAAVLQPYPGKAARNFRKG